MKKKICRCCILFMLFSLGCERHHHMKSKDKYRKMQKQNTSKVEIKKILEHKKFVSRTSKTGEKFLVERVWTESKEQSCKACHEGFNLSSIKGSEHARSHWQINLKHASSEIMNCQTCHLQDEVWKFQAVKSSLDVHQTPSLCAKCHSRQADDWEIGAHGKRAVGWQYERAVKNCVNCHNPHKPAFEKRWPKIAPFRPNNYKERL
ncbi:MAG: hypothetical protein AB8G05_16525 [Oligoflexales bacterium]